MSLALTYHSHAEPLKTLVDSLDARAPATTTITTHHLDLATATPADYTALIAAIQAAHGGRSPDILVANAGYGKRITHLADIPVGELDAMLTINLRAAFLLTQACVPGMLAGGWGRVVYVTSIAAVGGGINGAHYAASKAGVQGLMRNSAARYARDGLTFNDVAPAMIGETGMVPSAESVCGTPGDPDNIPVGRLGTPDEVAGLVEVCCRTGYMTGQSILLTGGLK